METIKQFWKEHEDIVTDNFLNTIKSDFSDETRRELLKRQLRDLLYGLDEIMEVKE